MDPAYGEIGPNTCVGMTGGWGSYSWPPAIILVSVMVIFLMDFAAERYVEMRYGLLPSHHDNVGTLLTDGLHSNAPQPVREGKEDDLEIRQVSGKQPKEVVSLDDSNDAALKIDRSFRQQIAAFLILEFGVIFHSVIIGLNLGTAGDEFSTLYPVIVFHQSFEGLGIGARLSAIPFPKRWRWLPWTLCAAYGLTTPIAIAIGLGLKTTYNGSSFTANIISGVFDSISAGILIYTGLVELLARDFLFNPERTTNNRELLFMVVCTLLGAALMALLGKWA
jgi:solute carrier family 39 (zinc transporter), member 1/2/3